MDQMASSLGREGEALFLDTRSLEFERLPLPPALDLVVIDSGIAHEHASGEYGVRRREAEAAAKALGVHTLRELDVSDLPRLSRLPPTLEQRARHIVTENARVLAARQALLNGNLPTLGALFSASHASLRDDYAVSVPAVDRLVAIAQSHDGVFGARMTGGGFGGAVIIAAARSRGADLAAAISREYDAQTGRSATVLLREAR
jgi:galactokinase